jgi:hypothetical protein
MCETPINVPHFVSLHGLVELKYKDYSPVPDDDSDEEIEDSVGSDSPTTITSGPARVLWGRLHDEICSRRETLLRLLDFVEEHFDSKEDGFKKAHNKIHGRYERHVQWLELHRACLKDVIDMESSQKANTMAELSIAESKRMMSCESTSGYLTYSIPPPSGFFFFFLFFWL